MESLRDWMRIRLDLPDGQLAAVAAVQTFGDYLVFHPHLHVLAATGLVDRKNRFHLMPVESVASLAELFRHRFIETLLRERLISEKKARQLPGWKHSGFSLDAGEKHVASDDVEGRRRLAEYLLRAPFSLEKITWKKETSTVIYRSKRSWNTKRARRSNASTRPRGSSANWRRTSSHRRGEGAYLGHLENARGSLRSAHEELRRAAEELRAEIARDAAIQREAALARERCCQSCKCCSCCSNGRD